MGLSADIQNIVQQSMSALGDLVKTFNFVSKSTSPYDSETGSVTITDTLVPVNGVLASFNSYEASQNNLLSTARKAIIPTLEFKGVNPDALDDQCVVDGITYKVKRLKADPAHAAYIFALTAVNDA